MRKGVYKGVEKERKNSCVHKGATAWLHSECQQNWHYKMAVWMRCPCKYRVCILFSWFFWIEFRWKFKLLCSVTLCFEFIPGSHMTHCSGILAFHWCNKYKNPLYISHHKRLTISPINLQSVSHSKRSPFVWSQGPSISWHWHRICLQGHWHFYSVIWLICNLLRIFTLRLV